MSSHINPKQTDASKKLTTMLQMPTWGKEEIENAFLLWIICAKEKAEGRFDLEEALKLSTSAVDYEGMHIILTLNKSNYISPSEVFEQFSRIAAQQLIKQVDLLNDFLSTAILLNSNEDYKTGEFDNYTTHPDFLLKFIREEIDWYQVKKLDLSVNEQVNKIGLGEYAEILRVHLKGENISKYRFLIEDDKLIDLLLNRENDFLIAVGSSIDGGMSKQEAINFNWNILINDPPTPAP